MDVRAAEADGREFWLSVLSAGGRTTVPRWTLNPVPGIEGVETRLPAGPTASLRRLASELTMPLSSVVLAAHARVLSALSGEGVVTTGYVTQDRDQALPCVVTTEPISWRALLSEVGRAEAALQSHQAFPVDDLKRETGLSGPEFETLFDPTGARAGSELAETAVLSVTSALDGAELVLRFRYRTDTIDGACAARIAGYHRTALELMLAELDAEHRRQSLLSADELRHQLDGLSGPHRELPDLRVHEVFEQQVRAHPDATAAKYGDRRLTYGQLNRRANKLARALQARGLGPEGVVAVVMERNPDWMTAVLAIFKAGGAYLPIEPHFPAERIATTLSRADCRLVLTESASTTALAQATESLPAVETTLVETVWDAGFATDNLGVEVAPGQLAYIYFTSGSTGEPKGAMCEHAGMLNHMYAKIDDLELDETSVVAQTAPQCFDISLWQLLSALLVGGQTLIVEQDVVLDVHRFTNKIVDSAATVLQIVPSYLEAVLSYLEQSPQKLADLRYVSVTGEAIKTDLAQRWFAAQPEIRLVNAYGLTETSDDTNHEVMVEAPAGPVPLGRPVNNVRVYIVDEYLSPVPLGAPGAIVFSGVCVGRGYINDTERTRLAFMADPHRANTRLYRGGDDGRWRPDGAVDFLGRTDHQVKLHGFRIEIGEIESTLMRVPDVHDCAVIVADSTSQNAHLVAFYSSPAPIPSGSLSDVLGESLPEYMVPSFFHWQESLPLTANGKIDRKTLRALAADLGATENDYQAPSTPTERRLAAVWSEVLGLPEQQIGRHDNFFERGGTSLSAMKLAVSMKREVSFKDLTQHPILADLAGVVDGRIDHRTGLLQCLSDQVSPPEGALVCFPYAGGNAVNFQPMAKALASSGLAVYAVELPGHDVGQDSEPFQPLDNVVDQVVTEIAQLGLGPVLLWGHSSGAAFAVETARRLQEYGVEVRRVFIAAHLLGDAADRRADIAELESYGNPEIATALIAGDGYTEINDLEAVHAEHIGAAYRHDCVSAHHYFLDVLDAPPKLSAPLTVVLATDDPYTAKFAHRHRDWRIFADQVDSYEIPDGGHYFVRTRPTEAAWAVLSSAQLPGAR